MERFRRFLRFRTVAPRIEEPQIEREFTGLLDALQSSFPRVFSAGRVVREDPWRLVIDIPGSDERLAPVLLLAHYDVVDVEPSTEPDWTHPPFDAVADEQFIWGRGALDDKNVLAALLEAVEAMLARDIWPQRGITLAFGGDEEVLGTRGAGTIAARFAAAGRRFHAVLDEGAVIARGLLAGPEAPLALIGVAEKGYADISISASVEGGHAAMPARRTAVGVLARAIARLEDRRSRPRLSAPVTAFFRALAPHAPFPLALIYGHPRLAWPLLRGQLSRRPPSDALVRTTRAVTVIRGGEAPNVLPQQARATVNCRILPGETVERTVEAVRRAVRGMPVRVELAGSESAHEPSAAMSVSHGAWTALMRALEAVEPECIPAPFLVTGTTDSRWYAGLAEATYRFVPVVLGMGDIGRIHGTDERIGIDAFLKMVDFYTVFLQQECVHG